MLFSVSRPDGFGDLTSLPCPKPALMHISTSSCIMPECSHHTGHSWHLKQSRVQVPTIAAVPRGRQTSLSIQALLMLYRIPLPAPQAPDLFSDATRLASIAPQREPELGDSGEEAQSWYFRCSLQQNPPKDIWVTQCLSPSHLSKCSCSFSLCSAPG